MAILENYRNSAVSDGPGEPLSKQLLGPWLSLPKIFATYVLMASIGTAATIVAVPLFGYSWQPKSPVIVPTHDLPKPNVREKAELLAMDLAHAKELAKTLQAHLDQDEQEFPFHAEVKYPSDGTDTVKLSWNFKRGELMKQGWIPLGGDHCQDGDVCSSAWFSPGGGTYVFDVYEHDGYIAAVQFHCNGDCAEAELKNAFGPVQKK